jgi:hypothetical protein
MGSVSMAEKTATVSVMTPQYVESGSASKQMWLTKKERKLKG